MAQQFRERLDQVTRLSSHHEVALAEQRTRVDHIQVTVRERYDVPVEEQACFEGSTEEEEQAKTAALEAQQQEERDKTAALLALQQEEKAGRPPSRPSYGS